MKRRRTEILIETDRTIVYAGPAPGRRLWCARCAAEAYVVSAFEAARLAGVAPSEVFRWAEDGLLHTHFTPQGVLQVCVESLPLRAADRADGRGPTPSEE